MIDYYKILNLSKNASIKEIKSSYIGLVKLHHPDVGGNENDFKLINEAYNVLKDDYKRKIYDLTSEQSYNHTSYSTPYSNKPMDFNEILKTYKETKTGYHSKRNGDINVEYYISLLDAYDGTVDNVTINGNDLKIEIPAGIKSGTKIKFDGLGRMDYDYLPAGDLYIKVLIEEHDVYKLNGNDLHTVVQIDSIDAIIGCVKDIMFIDGSILSINIPSGIQYNKMIKLSSHGMPVYNHPTVNGDLYIKVLIKTLKISEIDKNRLDILIKSVNLSEDKG